MKELRVPYASKERLDLRCRANARFVIAFGLVSFCAQLSFAHAAEPVAIPLLHVASHDDDPDDYDTLGIMIAVNDSTPRLFQFDTGSDEFLGQIDADVPGVEQLPGGKPGMTSYGDGTYGYWTQKVRFDRLSFHNPKNPADGAVATLPGKFVAGQVLDWVFSKNHYGFKDHKTSAKPVGYDDGTPLYADLDVRKRIKDGQPSDHPPFYGTYGAGDFLMAAGPSSTLGSQTRSGYVISANANVGDNKTPGCAPCLMLHLNSSVRSQFTAVMPWGKLGYDGYQRRFDQSDTNASNEEEGNYNYTISIAVGKKKRAVDFKGPILFDTGTPEFIFATEDNVVKKLRAKGFKFDKNDLETADFKLHGFADKLNDVEYDDVEIVRQDDEDEGTGLTIGLPFFQSNSLMYDLANKATAYSPYFVTIDNFSTDGTGNDKQLGRITSEMGASGFLGLAGIISGNGDLILEKDANVRMTAPNIYTGVTRIGADSYLHIAGPGSIEHSSRVIVDGNLYVEQKGAHLAEWGVSQSMNDAIIRNLEGGKTGYIALGSRRLVVTAAAGRFDGSLVDYDDAGKNLGGGLVVAGGNLTLGGDNEYSGVTEVAAGAELHLTGSISGDVTVSGALVVDGLVQGTITVQNGGRLTGHGEVAEVKVLTGGTATTMKSMLVD